MAKKIAHGIVFFRSAHGKIETTKQLADIIASTVKGYFYLRAHLIEITLENKLLYFK